MSVKIEVLCAGKIWGSREIPKGSALTVGRATDCDLELPDPHLSRKHFDLFVAEDGLLSVQNLGAKNPVCLNGTAVDSSILRDGDSLSAGKCVFIVRLDSLNEDSASSKAKEETKFRYELDAERPSKLLSSQHIGTSDRSQLESIFLFAESVVGKVSEDDILESVNQAINRELKTDHSLIGLGLPKSEKFEFRIASESKSGIQQAADLDSGVAVSQVILDKIYSERQAILAENISSYVPSKSESIERLGIHSFMCSPLLSRGELLGLIYVDRVNDSPAFVERDLDFLQGLAHLAATAISEAQLRQKLTRENQRLRLAVGRNHKWIAQSKQMLETMSKVRRYAKANSPVLVTGNPGSGKKMLVNILHDFSECNTGPLVNVKCAGISEVDLDRELFGYKKGAFKGARKSSKGKLKEAISGTLILEDVDAIPKELQSKLLRKMQEIELGKANGADGIRLVSISSSRSVDLRNSPDIQKDFYYKISSLSVSIPDLCKRSDDILPLAQSIIPDDCTFSADSVKALEAYKWPGNVTELQNVVEQALCDRSSKEIQLTDLPANIARLGRRQPLKLRLQSLDEVEANQVQLALDTVSGNKKRAAELLGISRNTLYKKIEQHGL